MAGLDDPRVAVPRQQSQLGADRRPEELTQRGAGGGCQLTNRGDAARRQARLGDRAHAPHQFHGQRMEEVELVLRLHHHQPVGLGDLRSDLRQVLGASHAHGQRQADALLDPPAYGEGDLARRSEEMGGSGYVQEGFVDGDPLDQGSEISTYVEDLVGQALVLLEVPSDEPELRAELPGPPPRHPPSHSEGLGLVGGRQHHPAAHGDGPAAQRWIQQLLYGGVEGIQIGVEDGGLFRHGMAALYRTYVRSA